MRRYATDDGTRNGVSGNIRSQLLHGAGDVDAAKKRLEAIKNFAHLELTAETERLAEQYVRELEIPHKAIRDSVHLALASIHQVDYLVTWNCTHIANGRVMKRVREINAANGIPPCVRIVVA